MNRFLLCYSKSHVIVRDFVNTKKHSRNVKLQIIITRVTPITLHLDTITSQQQFRCTEIVCPLLFGEKEMILLLMRYSIVLQKLLMNPWRKVNDGILQCNVLAGIVALIISDVISAE